MTGKIKVSTPLSQLNVIDMSLNSSIQECYEATGIAHNKPVLCICDGLPLLRKDWNTSLREYTEVGFLIVPLGGGNSGGSQEGSGKSVLRTTAFIALMLAAPQLAAYLSFAAVPIGVLQAGIVISGAFLINAVIPIDTSAPSDNTVSQASPTYNLQIQGNQARLMQPIPKLYGTHILYPDYVSQPYQIFENNQQVLFLIFYIIQQF